MSRYGIETIAESVYQSSVCPFMRERGCENGNEDCQKCVKEWFADHDKQIRNEVIENAKKVVRSQEFQRKVIQSKESLQDILCDILDQMKGEQNESNS